MSATAKTIIIIVSAILLCGFAAWFIIAEIAPDTEPVIYGEADTPLTINNIYADNITSDGAIVNITMTTARIDSFSVDWGLSPDALDHSDSVSVNGKRSKLSYQIEDLEGYTRYYYRFSVTSAGETTVCDPWSFITSDTFHSGASGGSYEGMTYGIDVSFWNEESDFEEIKNQGIDFVIIRCGSSYGKDRMFEYNYTAAKAAGLKVGAYYYTYAMNEEEAIRDAESCLSYVCGKEFDMPVYMDIEESEQKEAFSQRFCTEMVMSFCQVIDSGGYIAGLYTNGSWFHSTINEACIASVYEVWFAAWTTDKLPSRDYSDLYGAWQYTDSGKIPGITSSFVDRDVCYKNYSSLTESFVYYDYRFVDWDGSELKVYRMRPGHKIYIPDFTPTRESDDENEYVFMSWDHLDENTVSDENGGTFTAVYNSIPHIYGEWEQKGNFKKERTCEICGHIQTEYLADVFLGESSMWDFYDGVLTVTGSGDMKNGSGPEDFGWHSFADDIVSVVISDGITSIGNYEFANLKNLESISLPMTLDRIGENAFSGSPVQTIKLPASLEFISGSAFDDCDAKLLCFKNSYALEYAVINGLNHEIVSPTRIKSGSVQGVSWFFYDSGELIIAGKGKAESVASKTAFCKETATTVTIGQQVDSVGAGQFSGWHRLSSVSFLGDNPRTVGENAFKDCCKLGSVTIPKGSTIPENAFEGTLIFG